MKITNIEAVYPKYQFPVSSWRDHFWQIVVRIETDVGVVGLGYGGGGVGAVAVVNQHFRALLVGRQVDSVDDIAAIWDTLYHASLPYGRRGIAVMALSGVDLALWDLLAKAENLPVYKLISKNDPTPVRAYASGADIEWYAELGYTAHKFSHRWRGNPADYDVAVQAADRARQILGPDALIMADCYMSWDADVTLEMATRLAPYNLYWFEDVLTPDELSGQAKLREAISPINLAGGEHEFTHHGFAEIARHNALDIWQPDITWCGGVTALLRILDIAKQAEIPVVLHRGGEVWGLHAIVATGCEDIGELLPGKRDQSRDILWFNEPSPVDGYLTVTDAPGFGVTLNETMLP